MITAKGESKTPVKKAVAPNMNFIYDYANLPIVGGWKGRYEWESCHKIVTKTGIGEPLIKSQCLRSLQVLAIDHFRITPDL